MVFVLTTGSIFGWLRIRSVPELVVVDEPTPLVTREVVGHSVMGRPIEMFTYGAGEKTLVFVGGVHGGYEWNSVLLAYEFMDYLEAHPEFIPAHLSIVVVPSANPDGLAKIIGKEGRFSRADVPEGDHSEGRFNAHGVDLNRNFGCKWSPESTWRSRTVSGGTEAFSEPEAQALQKLVSETHPEAVVFWHSQANAVYASECEDGILPVTSDIMNAYASAAGYKAVDVFDSYTVTGDSEGWLASVGIPAITVELSSHESIEWDKNLRGVQALISYFEEGQGLAR